MSAQEMTKKNLFVFLAIGLTIDVTERKKIHVIVNHILCRYLVQYD